MINAKELRIGNYVHKIDAAASEGKIDYSNRLHVISHNDIYHIVEDGDPTNHPIPLTPEWLERCGFIGLTHLGKKEYSLEIDDELTIEVCFYDHLTIRLVITNDNCDENIALGQFVCYRTIPQCNLLHQLQNIYHSLTGEELEIKL